MNILNLSDDEMNLIEWCMENMYCDLETDDDEMRDYESIMLKINTARGDVPVQKVDTVHRRKDLDLL
tara:strand:- start:291 stop:491 length:201 start_codon:yes stop_codon:yes gene_type:complete